MIKNGIRNTYNIGREGDLFKVIDELSLKLFINTLLQALYTCVVILVISFYS